MAIPIAEVLPKLTWTSRPLENSVFSDQSASSGNITSEKMGVPVQTVSDRKRVVLVFDPAYSEHGLAVYGAVQLLMSQLGDTFSYEIFCSSAYRGPKFGGSAKVKVSQPARGVAEAFARIENRIKRSLTSYHLLESPERWESNIEQNEEGLLECIFEADRIQALLIFSTDAGFCLRIARWAHIYASVETPHLVLVTSNDRLDARTAQDLKWLGVHVLRDGDLVVERRQKETAVGGTGPDELIPSIFSFLPASEYPRQLTNPSKQVHWPAWIGLHLQKPARVRDVVLFVRPDWMNCGSGTTFESLARWFRQRDALLIDVGIWPYRENFDSAGRRARIKSEQNQIRAALYFSARMSTSLPHLVRQFSGLHRRFPWTLARQKSFQHRLAAKPRLMQQAIRRAKVTHIYVNHYFTYEYAQEFIAGRPFFLDTHDVQTVNFIHYNQLNALTRRVDRFEDSLRDEMEIAGNAQRLCFVSAEEIDLAARYISRDRLDYVLPLPHVVPCQAKPLDAPARLLIVASNNAGNVQNVHWFLTHVWPVVLELCGDHPSPSLKVCGSIDKAMSDVRAAGVDFVGVVPDLRPYYHECDLVILPVVVGGGVAIKTLEAVLHERPVLATRHALRGLPESVVEAIGHEDDPQTFARLLLEIATNTQRHMAQLKKSQRAAELLNRDSFYDILGRAVDSVRVPALSDLQVPAEGASIPNSHGIEPKFRDQEPSTPLVR